MKSPHIAYVLDADPFNDKTQSVAGVSQKRAAVVRTTSAQQGRRTLNSELWGYNPWRIRELLRVALSWRGHVRARNHKHRVQLHDEQWREHSEKQHTHPLHAINRNLAPRVEDHHYGESEVLLRSIFLAGETLLSLPYRRPDSIIIAVIYKGLGFRGSVLLEP